MCPERAGSLADSGSFSSHGPLNVLGCLFRCGPFADIGCLLSSDSLNSVGCLYELGSHHQKGCLLLEGSLLASGCLANSDSLVRIVCLFSIWRTCTVWLSCLCRFAPLLWMPSLAGRICVSKEFFS